MTLFGIFMSFHTWSPLHSLARAWPKWMRISETRFKMTKWVHIISGTIMKFRIVWDTVNPSLNYWELSLNCSERLPHNLSSQLWHKMTSFCPRPQVCTPWTVFVLRNESNYLGDMSLKWHPIVSGSMIFREMTLSLANSCQSCKSHNQNSKLVHEMTLKCLQTMWQFMPRIVDSGFPKQLERQSPKVTSKYERK